MAVIAAGGLVLGAAACSDDDDDSDSTATATAASTEDADAGSDGSDGADTSGSEGADGAEGSDGGSGDGEAVTDASQLPEDIAAAYEQAGGEAGALGAFSEFTTDGDNTLATFANGWITSSPETGAQPLIGEIGNTWNEGGALQNPVGLPTAPETGDPVSGWDQEFQNGTIGWHPDETGTWAATE
jgi:uncharacterized protein with LGFP repeats